MGRQRRAHAPGMVFHLTSRLHRREPFFTPDLREEVAGLIRRMIGRSDARLLAYVVMPNHLHIMLRQGRSTLGAVMQPLMRRVAYRVQARHRIQGTIVERRFRDRLCQSPNHLREALMYVHLNPYRAGLCGADLAYGPMTHQAYLPGGEPEGLGVDPMAQMAVLQLFAQQPGRSRDELCDDYQLWLARRMDRESMAKATGHQGPPASGAPSSWHGDRAWRRHFGHLVRLGDNEPGETLPDLRDFVMAQVSSAGAPYTLVQLLGSRLPRETSRYRARLIRAAARRGYRTGKLAEFFAITPAAVSLIKYGSEPERETGRNGGGPKD